MGKRIISGWRPSGMSRQEEELRWRLATGKITFAQYERAYKRLKKQGLIQRNGKVIT